MARVTDEEVRGIIEATEDEIFSLNPFIDAANQLVTDLCSGDSYSAAKLRLIELWLAAHFYAVRSPRPSEEGAAGGVSVKFQGQTAMHLEATIYGQQAMLLDTAGNLAALNSGLKSGKRTIGITWLGSEIDEIVVED